MSYRETMTVILQKSCSSMISILDAAPAILSECTKIGYDVRFLDAEPQELSSLELAPHSVVPVLGYSESFLRSVLRHFGERDISGLIVGLDMPLNNCSCIYVNRAKSVRTLLDYFRRYGKTKTALFGINSLAPSDNERCRAYLSLLGDAAKQNIFFNNGSLSQLCDAFPFERFDSVICANDMAAAMLVRAAKERNISLTDTFIAGSGNTCLAAHTAPSLTSFGINYAEAGRLAVRLYKFLTTKAPASNIRLEMEENLNIRESTGNKPYIKSPAELSAEPMRSGLQFVNDRDVLMLDRLDRMLSLCDDIDLAILKELQSGLSREQIAEKLHIGISTFRYRLNKMCMNAGASGRKDLLSLLDSYRIIV